MEGSSPTGVAADTTLVSHAVESAASPRPGAETICATVSIRPSELQPTDSAPAQAAAAGMPARESSDGGSTVGSVEVLDECFVVEACVDRYLWALYQRTPKEDTIKVEDQRKVTVRKKRKLVTVTQTFTRLV